VTTAVLRSDEHVTTRREIDTGRNCALIWGIGGSRGTQER
jgi:hypothetical protein